MRRWFLSYNSEDCTLAERVEASLALKDPTSRIYFSPKSQLAGSVWLPQIAEEIAQANVFVLLIGENGAGRYQVREYNEAFDKLNKVPDFSLIPVLLEGQAMPGLPFVGQFHWIVTPDPASEQTLAKLMDAVTLGGAREGKPWRHTRPYRGLEAMTEADSDFFFGRRAKIVETIGALAVNHGQLPVLIGNSGVGKSSLAQAGVIASLLRQGWLDHVKGADPWPQVFEHSRSWCFLTMRPGTDPIKALVDAFLDTWNFKAGAARINEQKELIKLFRDGKATVSDLLDATERRYKELRLPSPPGFFLYIDQGEELYIYGDRQRSQQFSKMIADALGDTRLRALISLRADFYGEMQRDEELYNKHRLVSVPPLREPELFEIVSKPAQLLAARFQTPSLASDIARRAAEESAKDAGALPLLSYLLDDMWRQMVERGDGVLRLPVQAIELGRVLVDRANKFLSDHPKSENELRRIFTLKLATVRDDGEPTRRRALRSEFTDNEWRLVIELANNPNRLLVTSTSSEGETYAEVAHEAIFRRWERLREWIAAEREFLAWRSGLESARRNWEEVPPTAKPDALLMGFALSQARRWLGTRSSDISEVDQNFILQSARSSKRRKMQIQATVGVLIIAISCGVISWLNESYLRERWRWFTVIRPYMEEQVRPYVLNREKERSLRSLDTFRECAKNCPEMVVVPEGSFMMGSSTEDLFHPLDEMPPHEVKIETPFAVSKFEVTFDDWDACVLYGDCSPRNNQNDRSGRPVTYISLNDAQMYASWLSKMTGKNYHLLSEAQWEYAARAGSSTAYPWGNDMVKGKANCGQCGNEGDGKGTMPVGSFPPNAFGLHDMHGNVWEWVADCYVEDYENAPANGSTRLDGNCSQRVVRGGSWVNWTQDVRSAKRGVFDPGISGPNIGFRLARSL
jgi:formylglycine-generating enzyme required for sulfatase activity